MQDRAVANEFEGPQGGKSSDGISVGTQTRLGESGGQADHILFGHADIDEAIGEAGAKGLHHHVAQVASEQDYAFVSGRQVGEGVYEGFPQLAASTSRIAISNSCSLIGR